MKILVGNDQDRPPLVSPLISILVLVLLSIGAFLIVSQHYINALFGDVESQYRQGLISIVTVARNAVEPVLRKVRAGEISPADAIEMIRPMIRAMTYEDQDGLNYLFMSTQDGTTLVQPFDPDQEMKNRLALQDVKGVFILKELIKASKAHPEGSFVRYHYPHFPDNKIQEKLTYVISLPEIDSYIGTGMYIEKMLQKQRGVLANVKYAAVCLLIVVLIPIAVSVFTMLNRNRRLLAEVGIRKRAEEELEKLAAIVRHSSELVNLCQPDGRMVFLNEAGSRMLGIDPEDVEKTHILQVIPDHWKSLVENEVLPTILAGGSWEGELQYVNLKTGDLTDVHALAFAMDDPHTADHQYLANISLDISLRKRAEERMRENEARLSSIIQNMPGFVFQFTAKDSGEMGMTYASEGLTELFGLSPDFDIMSREFLAHLHEEDREGFVASVEKAVAKGAPWAFEGRFIKDSGEVIWFHGQSTPTRHEDQLVFDGVLMNVTKRKHVEEELKASESMLRSLFAVTPIGITFCRDRVILVANEFMCDLMGYSQQELVGDTGRKFFVTEQEYEEVCREIDSQIPLTGCWSTETRHVRKDGSILDVILSGALLRAEDPSAGHVITVRDVTQRRRAEAEAQRLRNYLSSIIDSMPSVLVGVDENGCVTQWNAAAERTTGVKGEMARGRPLDQVLPMLRRQLDELRQTMRTRTVTTQAKVPRVVNGELCYEDVTVYPLMSNGVEGAVIRVDDVTERVRIEEMMVQSEKMLSVGGLAAGMAHEINNPLGVILQAAQNILRRVSPDLPANVRAAEECGISLDRLQQYLARREVLIFLEDIRRSGERAADIVANMLSFSRKAEGGGVPVDMAELLDRTVSLAASDYDLKKRYDFRQINIVREYQPAVPRVVCEAGKIQQVFLNILRNGAEAMMALGKAGRPAQFVLRVLRDGVMVRVEIEDNGPGMDEATRRRVFEPFFTTKPPGSGTGLGLSVSYFIVTEDHEGSMSVESSPGMGSRFVIRLPVMGQRRRGKD